MIELATILIALVVAYAYVWLPLTRERDRLLETVPKLRADARQVERMAAELGSLERARPKPAADIKAAIERTAGAMAVVGVAAQPGQSVRVTIASAEAAPALSWIARIQSAYGARPERLRMSLLEGNRVKIEVDLATTQ